MVSKKEAMRKKALGELGELVALKTLVDKGFEKITHLNDAKRMNFPFARFSSREGWEEICDKRQSQE